MFARGLLYESHIGGVRSKVGSAIVSTGKEKPRVRWCCQAGVIPANTNRMWALDRGHFGVMSKHWRVLEVLFWNFAAEAWNLIFFSSSSSKGAAAARQPQRITARQKLVRKTLSSALLLSLPLIIPEQVNCESWYPAPAQFIFFESDKQSIWQWWIRLGRFYASRILQNRCISRIKELLRIPEGVTSHMF